MSEIESVQPSEVVATMPPLVPHHYQAQYACVYMALHHITSVINDVLAKLAEEPNPKHHNRMLRERIDELKHAAGAIDMYASTPPEQLSRTYENFVAIIASQEHLRKSNANLANNFRLAESMLREIGEAMGGGMTSEEIVAEIKTREAERAKTAEKMAILQRDVLTLTHRKRLGNNAFILSFNLDEQDGQVFSAPTLDEVLDKAAAWVAGGAK